MFNKVIKYASNRTVSPNYWVIVFILLIYSSISFAANSRPRLKQDMMETNVLWGNVQAGLRIGLMFDKTNIFINESIAGKIVMQNTTNRPLDLRIWNGTGRACPFGDIKIFHNNTSIEPIPKILMDGSVKSLMVFTNFPVVLPLKIEEEYSITNPGKYSFYIKYQMPISNTPTLYSGTTTVQVIERPKTMN